MLRTGERKVVREGKEGRKERVSRRADSMEIECGLQEQSWCRERIESDRLTRSSDGYCVD